MMQESDVQQYCALMEEVKLRVAAVDALMDKPGSVGFRAVAVESIYLQLRKILELIALGSLVANKEAFSKAYARFANYWNADRLLKDMARVNPDFYPKPMLELPSASPAVKRELVDRQQDYLTTSELVQLYNRCADVLHARNPYKKPLDLPGLETGAQQWREKVVNLLNTHAIHLVGNPGFYLVHMSENDGKVHMYTFAPQ